MVRSEGELKPPKLLKREDCKCTKHDSLFSPWKILIGPTDWKNYSMGMDGAERYRIHNLPIRCSCPGLYELGIAASCIDLGRDIGKLNHDHIIVVYLGQAENVRTRLQHYGRAGSHLENGMSFGFPYDSNGFSLKKGPGLFTEIFSRGFPIVFRWARMDNKKEAEKAEALLLGTFDYAWNKGGNGVRRANDIFLKLDKSMSKTTSFNNITNKLQQWVLSHSFGQKKVGIKIKVSSQPSSEIESTCFSDQRGKDLRSRIFKFGRSRPSLVEAKCRSINNENISGRNNTKRSTKGRIRRSHYVPVEKSQNGDFAAIHEAPICDGSTSKNEPTKGIENEVWDHKENKSNGSICRSLMEEKSVLCGIILEDGLRCMEKPVHGRKRCELHKGRRICRLRAQVQSSGVCGVVLGEGLVCMEVPVDRRKRCDLHRGKRVC